LWISPAQVVEQATWIPTVRDMSEDGLLRLGFHVASFAELRPRADQHFKEDWPRPC
jgi:hypothetical protein